MALNLLSDGELLQSTRALVTDERKLQTLILEHLREIDDRSLHLKLGYSSLYEYCRTELGYTEGAAFRRIKSMQLIREVPAAKAAIESGALSLTNAASVQVFCARTELPLSKVSILEKVQNKGTRDCERLLVSLDTKAIPEERERAVSSTHTELRLVIDEALHFKLERLKTLLSHQLKDHSTTALLEKLADLALKKFDPELKIEKTPNVQTGPPPGFKAGLLSVSAPKSPAAKLNRTIPAPLRRMIWRRDQGQCTHRAQESGRRCAGRRFLQIDHVQPYSQGGSSTNASNLRLLCQAHNQSREVLVGERLTGTP